MEITQKMVDYFYIRTNIHINLVKKWYKRIVHKYTDIKIIDVGIHDKSKFEEPEFTPYVHITWMYKCKDEGVDYELPENTNIATAHHITTNRHHPEYWDKEFDPDSNLNHRNRDEVPENIVDATKMPIKYLVEMMADHMAMSEEKRTSLREWEDKNIGKRWKFSKKQRDLIYELVDFYDNYIKR